MARNNAARASRAFYSAAEKRSILDAYRTSGLSQTAFAARGGISVHTLRSWIYKPRYKVGGGAAALVEIASGFKTPGAPNFQVQAFEVDLRGGHRLRIPSGFDPGEVRTLLSILEGAC